MENRIGTCNGAEIPRKSKSLDLKSLYKSRISMESQNTELKRKISSEDSDEKKRKKRRKSSKTVSISSLRNVDNCKNSLDEAYNGVLGSGSHDSKLKLSHKRDDSGGLNAIYLSLDDSSFQIPKRKRGFVGRRKVEVSQELKLPRQSCSKVSDDVVSKAMDGNMATKVESPKELATQVGSPTDLGVGAEFFKDSSIHVLRSKVKRKMGFDNFKEKRDSESNVARLLKEGAGHASNSAVSGGEFSLTKVNRKSESNLNWYLKEGECATHSVVNNRESLKKSNKISNSNLAGCLKEDEGCASQSVVNNGDSSLKKSRKNHDKRNDPTWDRSIAKEAKPIIDTSVEACGDALDDEENLEENAAMMLLSRFDPNCTGFSSNEKSIASMNGFSLLSSSEQDFSGHESVSFDAAGRALRPRTRHKERGQSRKRRHYYEIFSGDLDAYWALNRRIKIFWPLDQCWYYGLVSDYDKESKLHHVKYDDRDEEWINLRNEKFKLLLLPSEVPDKGARKRSKIREKGLEQGKGSLKPSKEKGKRDMTTKDDKCMGSCMDTEPIISWLARSTNRIKSLPLHAMKKQKRPDPSLTFEASFLSHEVVKPDVSLGSAFLKAKNNKLASTAKLLDSFIGGRRSEESSSCSPTHSKDSKLPIVYCRRRFRSTSSGNHVSTRTPSSITLLAPSIDGFVDSEEYDICMKMLAPDGALQSTGNTELLNLTIPLIESRQVRFEICFPVLSVLKYAFGAENFWLLRAVFLFHYGTVTTIWPIVNLEMLFVDNIVGLRFFLFEGCLKQAVAFVFLVLRVFHRPNEQGKYADLPLPVTSIRFKFSCIHNLGKQFVFTFYNFSEIKNSLWMYLDTKLKSHCQLSRQLSLSECTYDNIKAIQNGSNVLSMNSSLCRDSSLTKGLWKMSRQGVSREFTRVKVSQFFFPDRNQRKFPPFALSFTAAPSFFLSLHLKLLMEHRADHISFQGHDLVEHPECAATLMMDDCSSLEYCLDKHPETNHEHNASKSTLENNVKGTTRNAVSDGYVSVAKPELPAVSLSACVDGRSVRSPQKYENGDLNGAGTSGSSQDCEETGGQAIDRLQRWQCYSPKLECVRFERPSVDSDKTDAGSLSPLNGIRVEIPNFNQFERHVDREFRSAQRPTDLIWNMNGGIIPSRNPTAPRSTWNRNRNSFSSFAYLNQGWSDGKDGIARNNFGYGPRKPRTQVPYSSPFGGFDYGLRNRVHNQQGLPHARIRRANEKRLSDATRDSQKNLELLCCDANVLITHSDKCWRECGAQIVLELSDHNEWKLAIKLSGTTRYLYKAHQFLQPGSTNRFTHAMMWKGGKDWTLEFPDRSQWFLFKEMHEECYNRNIRAASVKNIPIPGVHLIEDCDDIETEVAFVRSSSKYFQQVETDVEMALNPSRVLYDMDSDDEQWIMKMRNSSESDISGLWEISEEMFEKIMDMFEKAAYSQQQDQFTPDEIEEFMAGVGPMDTIKIIYEHWREKRLKKGIPLIRHLQPPSWERYQQQVKEWEVAMSKSNCVIPNGCQGKAAPIEKPLMFAFCLKPRGLEVPNRGSKHRSHRKISVSGHSNLAMGDHDGFHNFGRRLNGFAFGDEKVVYTGLNYEYLDDSPLSQTSPRVFSPRVYSPRDAGSISCFSMSRYGFDKHQYQKLQRGKSKKFRVYEFSYDAPMVSPCNQQMMGKRNGIYRWNMGYSEWSSQRHLHPDGSQRHGPGQLDGSDLDEFRLRDASGVARHAHNMAKLKREKAQRLLYRADLAISKAVNALMIAEAIKASFDDENSDG
ncbi:uncharacterized protein LOC123194340 [Mangifera indica]|uniref:uncharacterized protein LOC123194340 n=1 Tax=Mangifera indica TaxID=29780 RepID=UPI001CFA689A|nr:uncharacterized protein LOC123194340 [Mangifera indica]